MTETLAELQTRAFTDPAEVIEIAAARLHGAAGAERVELLRLLGNACRELLRIDESVSHLRTAVDERRRAG